jgi:hypothetical protein
VEDFQMKWSRIVMGVVSAVLLVAPAAGWAQDATIAAELQLRLNVDAVNKTWAVTAEVHDPGELSLGLQSVQFDVTGADGIEVLDTTVLEFPLLLETGQTDPFQKGFTLLRDAGSFGQDIQASQPLSNLLNPVTGNNAILEGVGETAFTETNPGYSDGNVAVPALLATGTWDYTGADSHGSLSVVTATTLHTLLPSSLPPADEDPDLSAYSSVSAAEVDNHIVFLGDGVTRSSLVFDGLVEIADGASATIHDLDVDGDLLVGPQSSLDSQLTAITGDAEVGLAGAFSADQMALPGVVQIDGVLYVYTDQGYDSSLGSVTIGADGELVLTDRPVEIAQMLAVNDGSDPYAAIPEPTSLVLLGLGGLAVSRRRMVG